MQTAAQRVAWIFGALALFSTTVGAQTPATITGTVTTRADGLSLPGATVSLVGSSVTAAGEREDALTPRAQKRTPKANPRRPCGRTPGRCRRCLVMLPSAAR